MFHFSDVKKSTKSFDKLLGDVQRFLTLCDERSKIPTEIRVLGNPHVIWQGTSVRCEMQNPLEVYYLENYRIPLTARRLVSPEITHFLAADAMMKKLAEMSEISKDPERDVHVGFDPRIDGVYADTISGFPVVGNINARPKGKWSLINRISFSQCKRNPDPKTIWVAVEIATRFDTVDEEFLAFLKLAHKKLRLRLQPAGWRRIERTKKGRLWRRKIAFNEQSGTPTDVG